MVVVLATTSCTTFAQQSALGAILYRREQPLIFNMVGKLRLRQFKLFGGRVLALNWSLEARADGLAGLWRPDDTEDIRCN